MMDLITPFLGYIIPAVLAVVGLAVAFMKGKSGAEKKAKAEAEVVAARHQRAQADADRAAADAQIGAVADRAQVERHVAELPQGKAQEELRENWTRD